MFSDRPAPVGTVPAPGLLILTGASHTGKTTVAQAIVGMAEPPAALLSVDGVLTRTLIKPPGDVWREIPLAYKLLLPQAETLLDRGWLVVFESTFTFVPETGPPEFHADELDRLIAITDRRSVPSAVVQLTAGEGEAVARAESTGRLSPEIVAMTVKLHETATLPPTFLRLDSTGATGEDLALRALAAFSTDPRA